MREGKRVGPPRRKRRPTIGVFRKGRNQTQGESMKGPEDAPLFWKGKKPPPNNSPTPPTHPPKSPRGFREARDWKRLIEGKKSFRLYSSTRDRTKRSLPSHQQIRGGGGRWDEPKRGDARNEKKKSQLKGENRQTLFHLWGRTVG